MAEKRLLSILLVEDDTQFKVSMSETLREAGLHVVVSTSESLSLPIVKDMKFDVIIAGCSLSTAQGFKTARTIRTLFPQPPLILLSNDEYIQPNHERLLQISSVLPKPVSGMSLIKAIRHAVTAK